MNAAANAGPRAGPLFTPMKRNLAIASGVLVLHMAALWALQTGLLRRAVEIVVPAEVLSEMVTPPTPQTPVPPARPLPQAAPTPTRAITPTLPPPPMPLAIADPTPAPTAVTGVTTPQPPAPPITAPVSPATTAPAAAPAAKVELPSSEAEYLQNPKPPYPALSKRLGEQGTVLARVLIGADGQPQKAELQRSSGFERLDQAALATVLRWRYVPGKRAGVPEAMWFNVPIQFVLE